MGVSANTFPTNNGFGDDNPDGAGSATANPLGWPGIWPTAHLFETFDPTIAPTSNISDCMLDHYRRQPGARASLISDDYECDATTLHLPNRATQIDATMTPGAAVCGVEVRLVDR